MSRDPMPIGDSLNSVLRSLRNDSSDTGSSGQSASQLANQMASQMGGVFGRWTDAVGEAVAAHVKPIKLDGTKLIVEVDDPAWATQLRFLETAFKQRLLEVAGATVETVEVRVKGR